MNTQFRRVILVMLTLAMVINYLDRSALAYAMPFITKDFHLTPEEKGIIFGSFSIGYALFNFIGGVLADKFGPKRVFCWSMSVWSIICGLTAGCFNFWTMFIARAFFGAGEGPISTTANKVVNNWFPLNERARAVGINQAGGPLGGAISGPVVGFLCLTFNWRISFIIIAFIGITWAIIWALIATDKPRDNKRVSAAEAQLIEGEEEDVAPQTAPGTPAPSMWSAILQPSILATALSLFCFNYVLFFFMNWFPTFLVDTTGISLKDMSLVGVLPWVAGTLGYVSGGFIIDFIYRKTGKQLFSRNDYRLRLYANRRPGLLDTHSGRCAERVRWQRWRTDAWTGQYLRHRRANRHRLYCWLRLLFCRLYSCGLPRRTGCNRGGFVRQKSRPAR